MTNELSQMTLNDLCGYYTAVFRQTPQEYMSEILTALSDFDFDLCDRLINSLTTEEQNQLKNYMIKRIGD